VVFALLAFTSQSFAVVNFPCSEMNGHSKAPFMGSEMAMHMDMGMDHSIHLQIDDSATTTADTADCCSHEQCSMTSCISGAVAIVEINALFAAQFSKVLNVDYMVSALTADISSPFRPPISR
jgi:hypothetical protein